MEDIWQEAARREGAAPPRGSPIGWWLAPGGGVDTDFKDEEVTLQEGGSRDLGSHHSSLQAPLKHKGMLVTSSAHLWLD